MNIKQKILGLYVTLIIWLIKGVLLIKFIS